LSDSFLTQQYYLDVIDKTAEFVAENGPEFETKILQGNEGGKFNFLKSEHPYHAYYKSKVDSIFNGK
jgi:splicing factor 3A subunit 1